jgi:hypothetical protein
MAARHHAHLINPMISLTTLGSTNVHLKQALAVPVAPSNGPLPAPAT